MFNYRKTFIDKHKKKLSEYVKVRVTDDKVAR